MEADTLTVDTTGAQAPVAPNPGGQARFCDNWRDRYVALEGGYGAGKTWAGARKLVTLHISNGFDDDGRPTNIKSACIAPTYGNAKDFDIPALLEACEEAGLHPYHKITDANIIFEDPLEPLAPILVRSADKPERIAGFEVGAIWGDEPARWKENRHDPLKDPFIQSIGRLRSPKARFLQAMFTYTNEGDHTKIYEEFNSAKHAHALYRAGTIENPAVETFYSDLILQLTPELKKQYLDGEAISLRGGRVYESFDTQVGGKHINPDLKIIDGVPLQLSLDFNIEPGMHGIVGQYNQAEDSFTAVHELYQRRMDVKGLVGMFQMLIGTLGGWKWPELEIYGDATGEGKWAGTGNSCYDILREGLKAAGIPYRLRVPRSNPLVVDRVNAFNIALLDVQGKVHYQVHPRCERLITDLAKLKRDEKGAIDKTERMLSHASDAEGYRIYYLRPIRPVVMGEGRYSV